MKETITIFAEDSDEITSLVLQQLIDLLRQQKIKISNIERQEDSESKSIFVTTVVIPVAVGLTSTIIYDSIKFVGSRLLAHIHGKKIIKMRTTKDDGSICDDDIEIGNDK